MVNGASQDPWAAYGAMQVQHLEPEASPIAAPAWNSLVKQPYPARQRMKMNIIAIFISLFFPWLLFTLLYADVSFHWHYKYPQLCWALVGFGVVMCFSIGLCACLNLRQMSEGSPSYQPTWFLFLFLTSLAAVALGPTLGHTNFHENMQPYYDLQNLNGYTAVDPGRMRGQEMMDAGRVQFAKGATLDVSKAYAFQNGDTYCVAPITMYGPQLGGARPLSTYDFWAVGINCCGGTSAHDVDFKCGAYASTEAHEGVRMMSDTQRSFLRLAVQQAEAAHMITATHPLFFYWTDDAVSTEHGYLEKGFRNFAICMMGFFAVQLGLVLVFSYILSKMGYSNL